MLLIPLLCTALTRSKRISQKERDVLPLSYGSQMEMDYSDDAYLEAVAVKEEGEKEEEGGEADSADDPAAQKEAIDDGDEVAPATVEEAENKEDAGDEDAPAGLDFTTDIETEQEGMEMVQKIAKALKAVNKWMAGLVSYWNRIVEDSGVVTDILASAKGGDDTEETESAAAPAEEGEDTDANVDTDAEESDKDADTNDKSEDEAETKSDADAEDGDESKDDAETKSDADAEDGDESKDEIETKADADSEVDAEAEDDAETKPESDTEGDAETDAEAETKTDEKVPLEAGEPDAERVMARRRNFLRKPQQMPNYVDY